MIKSNLDKALRRGQNVTLGIHGPGCKSDYLPLLDYAKQHPGRVSLSVKPGHMTTQNIAWLSLQPGVRFVWYAAKWPSNRWNELATVLEARRLGGNVGLTVAAYNSDSGSLLATAINNGTPVRLVKGYYRSDLTTGHEIDTKFRELVEQVVSDYKATGAAHAVASHDDSVISTLPPRLLVCQYSQRSRHTRGVDLYFTMGWAVYTILTEIWFVGKPSGLLPV